MVRKRKIGGGGRLARNDSAKLFSSLFYHTRLRRRRKRGQREKERDLSQWNFVNLESPAGGESYYDEYRPTAGLQPPLGIPASDLGSHISEEFFLPSASALTTLARMSSKPRE